MQQKTPALIEFRKRVNALIEEGAFKAPEDPLIYAIKERQRFEISHRIENEGQTLDHPNFGDKPWRMTQDHLARVFYRDDILEPDDYQYLFSVLSSKSRGILLSHLVKGNCDGADVLGGGANVWISKFLQSYDHPHNPLEPSITGAVFHGARLVKLLSAHVPNVIDAAQTHLRIEQSLSDKPRALRMSVELEYLKSAFGGTFGAPSAKDSDKWLEEYAIVLELRKENAKDLKGKTLINLIENHLRYLGVHDHIEIEPEPSIQLRPGYDQFRRASDLQLESVFGALSASLGEDLDHLIEFFRKAPSQAIQAFGKPETKGEGSRIPGAMQVFANSLQNELVPREKSKRLLEQMVVAILSVNHKNMDTRKISEFLDAVKDKVDWSVIVGDLNTKGRTALIQLMPDSKPFRAFLPRADRGRVLENDLGM